MDAGDRRYFIEVKDMQALDIEICNVVSRSRSYQNYDTVGGQFANNVIPIDILYDPPDHPATVKTLLEAWCEKAIPNDSEGSGNLRRAIEQSLQGPMRQYFIWYAKFTGIDEDEAVKIFVDTNPRLRQIVCKQDQAATLSSVVVMTIPSLYSAPR